MRTTERGFLLLTGHLGNPERRVLTTAQLRTLADRMKDAKKPEENRELLEKDLVKLGYDREMAKRILGLLEEEAVLDYYLRRAGQMECIPITRVSPGYPLLLRQRLGLDSPGCLWAKGDIRILNTPAIALVGSRELRESNRRFAEAVGRQAAEQGLTLVSGNARGADRTAQEACLEAGGRVISIVADELSKQPRRRNLLYLSEDGFDEPFSAQRALSRNRCIHALGRMVFVAQSDLGKGGTWDGTVKNLRFGWSPVACFRDGSDASEQLEQMGAYLVDGDDLRDLEMRPEREWTFF
ncbi:MAG: DNA-processing protein DprA [Oscillospiraceae bacterium]|nr:DNA-processing protein DprA [Oscillospiraceae bacterium]